MPRTLRFWQTLLNCSYYRVANAILYIEHYEHTVLHIRQKIIFFRLYIFALFTEIEVSLTWRLWFQENKLNITEYLN